MGLRAGAFGLGMVLAGAMTMTCMAQQAGQTDDSDRLNLPLEGASTTNPSWVKTPDGGDIIRLYPPLATIMGIKGATSISCTVETTGQLSGCKVVRETPAGLGFGDAILLAAGDFRMNPAIRDGMPVQGQVTIPINWQMPNERSAVNNDDPPLPPSSIEPADLELARRVVIASAAAQTAEAQQERYMHDLLKQAVANGAAAPTAEQEAMVFSAFRQKYAFAASNFSELLARRYAADMTRSSLLQTAVFLESPAGRAWSAEPARQPSPEEEKAFHAVYDHAIREARDEICIRIGCDGHMAPKVARALPSR